MSGNSNTRNGVFAAIFAAISWVIARKPKGKPFVQEQHFAKRANGHKGTTPPKAFGSPYSVPKCMRHWRKQHGVDPLARGLPKYV